MISFKLYYEANIANAESLKQEIVSLLQQNSRTKPNLEPGGAIYKWFTNNLMKTLTGPLGLSTRGVRHYEPNLVTSLINLEPHKYKEGEPEWMAKDDVVDFSDTGNWPKMDHIIDYFNSLSDREREKIVKKPYEQVDKEVEQWDKDLAAQEKSSEGRLKEDADYDVLYKDGEFTWVKLKTKAAYECEGEGMGHCVGGYNPDAPENTIISLWDKKGEPHVTIEIQAYGGNPGNPYPDDFEEMVQIKGKQNHPPVGKYKDITAKFVKRWLDKGTFNEQATNIRDLEPSRVVRDDGRGIGMFRHEGGDGAWHWYFEDSKIWDKIYKIDVLPVQQARVQDILKKIEDEYDNVTTHNVAMSNMEGNQKFYVDDKRLSNSSFQNLVSGIPITVETRTIDLMYAKTLIHGYKCGFIKIDTEGTELDVLEGGEKVIERDKPNLMIEVYDKFNKYPVETTFEFCFKHGYECFYNHRGKGLQPVKDTEHGVKVAITMPDITDGDFLFIHGSRT